MSLKTLARNTAQNWSKRSELAKDCKHDLSTVPVPDPIDGHMLRPDEEYLPCKLCGVFVPRPANIKTAKNPAAVALGSLGGKSTSDAKRKASAENGKKGGRPKKQK